MCCRGPWVQGEGHQQAQDHGTAHRDHGEDRRGAQHRRSVRAGEEVDIVVEADDRGLGGAQGPVQRGVVHVVEQRPVGEDRDQREVRQAPRPGRRRSPGGFGRSTVPLVSRRPGQPAGLVAGLRVEFRHVMRGLQPSGAYSWRATGWWVWGGLDYTRRVEAL